nr:hypothetical protein [Tanacetum cinerariifolium]
YPDAHSPSQERSDKVFQANHSVQNEESSNEIAISDSNQEKEEPPQDSDMHQLIKECCKEICEEQKQSMEDTMLELNFRVVHKSSISFRNTSQISLIHAIAPILSTKEPEHSLTMGYKHLSITPEIESDEVTESNAENLLPILSECEVALEDKRNIVLREKLLSITRLISNIKSLNDNPTPDRVLNSFASDNSLLNNFSPEFETFYDHTEETRSGNTTHANDSLPEYDSFCFKIEPDQERLINLVENDILDDSTNDPLLGEADLFLAADHSIASGIENFYDSEGDIRFLKALLIDDSILSHELPNSNFEDNPLIPRPPPEPPGAETDAGEEIPVMM